MYERVGVAGEGGFFDAMADFCPSRHRHVILARLGMMS